MMDYETMMYAFVEWYLDYEHKNLRWWDMTTEEMETVARQYWDELYKEYQKMAAIKQRLINPESQP
jgi:hypothetical protein